MHAMLSMSSIFELHSRALEIFSVLAENTGGELKCTVLLTSRFLMVKIFSVLAENTEGELKCTVLLSHFQIPYGKKYDKAWLLSMIQSKCSVPFNPVEVRRGQAWEAGQKPVDSKSNVLVFPSSSFTMNTHGPSFLWKMPVLLLH